MSYVKKPVIYYSKRVGVKLPVSRLRLRLSFVLYLLSSKVPGLKYVSKRLMVYEATKAKTALGQ